jgi:hypothetical protein
MLLVGGDMKDGTSGRSSGGEKVAVPGNTVVLKSGMNTGVSVCDAASMLVCTTSAPA